MRFFPQSRSAFVTSCLNAFSQSLTIPSPSPTGGIVIAPKTQHQGGSVSADQL